MKRTGFARLAIFLSLLLGSSQLNAAIITPDIQTDPSVTTPDLTHCSLRYAIQSINDGTYFAACGTFAVGLLGTDDEVLLNADTYILEQEGSDENGNETGDIDVFDEVVITGAGSLSTTIDASPLPVGDRIFDFDAETATLEGLTLTGGNPVGESGGAIASVGTDLTLSDVRVVKSVAVDGGGIYFNGETEGFLSLIIENSTIDGNKAEGFEGEPGCGGGIDSESAVVAISNTTISRNVSNGDGGGICDFSPYMFLTNTTVSNNRAAFSGGGIETGGGLKGVYNVTIAFNQVTDNESSFGGGINSFSNFEDDRFEMQVFNTIIAQNTAIDGPDCFGTFGSGGNNLIGNIGEQGEADDCEGFADGIMDDQVGTPEAPIDPLLDELANNGGNTETHALLTGSPAIDAGNSASGCQALNIQNFIENDNVSFVSLTTDQRFFTRPIGILDPNTSICDIGAFEVQRFSFTITKDDGLADTPVTVGDRFTYIIIATNNGPGDADEVTLSDALPPQVAFESLTTNVGTCEEAAGVISCDFGAMAPGASATVTITVEAIAAGTAENTASLSIPPTTLEVTETTQINPQPIPTPTPTPTPPPPTPSPTPTPTFNGFVEGTGCSLALGGGNLNGGFSAMILAFLGIGLAWRRRRNK